MRDRKLRERELRRESIIKATEQLLKEKSFESITIDDIAIRSDFAKASIYQYFRNKDELMSDVFSKALETECRLIEEKCLLQTDVVKALGEYIKLEFDFICQRPWVPKFIATITSNDFRAENHLLVLSDHKKNLIAAIIQRGQTEGKFAISDLVVSANMIHCLSIGLANYLSSLSDHIATDLQSSIIDLYTSTIIKGMAKEEKR